MAKQKPWINVYPFNGRKLNIVNSGARAKFNPDLESYCEDLWKPKAEKGWKSSWIALAESIHFNEEVKMYAGAMPFYQVNGSNKAIEEKKDFAPLHGYTNCLSVGFPTATKDGYVIFQRRAPDVHCPNILIHEPCGYEMTGIFLPKQEWDNPQHANSSKLFDLKTQLDFRKNEIAKTFEINPELVSYEPLQDFLAAGWMSLEMYFSTTGKINANKNELHIPEKGEFLFVPFENLKELIYNQGRLSSIDVASPEYKRPRSAREIPLIDESLIGLIYGYKSITGERLDIEETVDRLNRKGMDIKLFDTSYGTSYKFPTYS